MSSNPQALRNPDSLSLASPLPITHRPREGSTRLSRVVTSCPSLRQGYQGMVDGGSNIVEADWESVSSILQVVGASLFLQVTAA